MSDGVFALKLDRASKLSLTVDISTSSITEDAEQVRLLLTQGDRSWVFKAHRTVREGRGFTVEVPALQGQAAVGQAHAIMEVIVGDRYFTPWSSEVTLEESLTVASEGLEVESEDAVLSPVAVAAGVDGIEWDSIDEGPVRVSEQSAQVVEGADTDRQKPAPPRDVPKIRSVADALSVGEGLDVRSAVDQLLARAKRKKNRASS